MISSSLSDKRYVSYELENIGAECSECSATEICDAIRQFFMFSLFAFEGSR